MSDAQKRPASKNPWYVLATLAGELKDDIDHSLMEKNRYYWNAWASQHMSKDEKAAVKNADGYRILQDTPEWEDVKDEAAERFAKRLPETDLPDPSDAVDFSEVEFQSVVSFNRFLFSGGAYFHRTTFSKDAYFSNATFSVGAYFDSATFSKVAYFGRATISVGAYFNSATFSGGADFNSATFSKAANFGSATFSERAYFLGVTFSEGAYFNSATFSGGAYFNSATFLGSSKFIKATFHKKALFTDAVFGAPCNLRAAKFETSYPDLDGTLLHNKTNVTDDSDFWPSLSEIKDHQEALNSCAHLRQNMAAQGLIEAEHFFFRREMAHKAKLAKDWERPFYRIYAFAEYGYGVIQPFLGLIVLWLSGAALLFSFGALPLSTATGLSFSNIFRFFGFQRVYFDAETIKGLNIWLELMTGAQTVIGYFLLFLLGLGLRNRFRLK